MVQCPSVQRHTILCRLVLTVPLSNEVFWGDGKDFEIQSTMLVFGEMAIWGDVNLGRCVSIAKPPFLHTHSCVFAISKVGPTLL